MKIGRIFMAFIPSLAFALNPQKNESSIQKFMDSYDPSITMEKLNQGRSAFGCPFTEYKIRGRDPVTGNPRTVELSFYGARNKSAPQTAVILLPPTGGVNILDRGYANEICSAGISVALISKWDHQDEVSIDFSMHDKGALRALAATRHVVEFLNSQNFDSIGVLGTSVGAIAGALAFGIEPRLSAAVLIVGSGRFADVITESTEVGAKKLREQRMKHLGLSQLEDYRKLVHEHVKIEPLTYLDSHQDRPSLVITADSDITVPTRYQYELAETIQASHLRLQGDHLEVIKNSFKNHRGQIVDFLKSSLVKTSPKMKTNELVQTY